MSRWIIKKNKRDGVLIKKVGELDWILISKLFKTLQVYLLKCKF